MRSGKSLPAGNRIMNAPFQINRPEVQINRPEVVDPESSTSALPTERRPGWLCIAMLVTALLATLVWIATLGWLVVKAFSLW